MLVFSAAFTLMGEDSDPVPDAVALNSALSAGTVEELKALLAAGGDPNAVFDLGDSVVVPLFVVAAMSADFRHNGYLHIEALLEAGANPNMADDMGDTALHHVAFGGNDALVTLLLKYGADPGLKNLRGETPYEMAMKFGNFDAVSAIEEASDYRHPDGEKLMYWGMHAQHIRTLLDDKPENQTDLERGVREVNDFLVEKGLISTDEKEKYDRKAIEQISPSVPGAFEGCVEGTERRFVWMHRRCVRDGEKVSQCLRDASETRKKFTLICCDRYPVARSHSTCNPHPEAGSGGCR